MSASLEQLIEAKLMAAFAAVVTARPVVGFWQPASSGTEKDRARSCVSVTVKPRSSDGWGSVIRSFQFTVSIEAAQEDDKTGSTIPADYAAIVGVMEGWQSNDNAETATDLTVTGFTADAFNFSDGGDCGYDATLSVWFATIQGEIKGCRV